MRRSPPFRSRFWMETLDLALRDAQSFFGALPFPLGAEPPF